MESAELVLPAEFNEYYLESKGYLSDVKLRVGNICEKINFYDPERLRQVIEDELHDKGVFYEPNLLFVASITRENLTKAVETLVASGRLSTFSKS